MATDTTIIDDLQARGLIELCNDLDGLRARVSQGPISAYCGYDPTADSLHVGSLLSVGTQRRFALHGHTSIVLVGGATGMIGDPSGKSSERNLLDDDVLDHNRFALHAQISRLIGDRSRVVMVDNRDWYTSMGALDFLRDVGKLVPLSDMLERTSVQSRLNSAAGMSFTEFSYQLLQAHDFSHLRAAHGCELQIGGTDQYGNILAGVDMIRRRGQGRAFGLVWPLLTKADGTKFGKSESGNIWLDPARTSPYAFHQFWFNSADADLRRLLVQFTTMAVEEVDGIVARHLRQPGRRLGQQVLADDLTDWVHGPEVRAAINRVQKVLFGDSPLDATSALLLERELPTVRLTRDELAGSTVEQLLARSGLMSSISEARRAVAANGASVGGRRVTPGELISTEDEWLLLARGRRHHALIRVVD